ncbi:helix-turn-helix domain-containing protein [Sphingopyxis sp. LC81]|uniref:helix-turn-helix domain-containing protein n=1 Tax=Sphingopyxis sp. LC81 TaxID=1502850 RepID=UPI0005657215
MEASTILGQNIRRVRKGQALSQEHLAFKAGVSRSFMSDVETGRRNPTIEVISRLSAALGVQASELVAGIPELATTPRRKKN